MTLLLCNRPANTEKMEGKRSMKNQ
uniref:Uncharacterized protein n=1 Tax=Anguilla anguilla TaxID=7936 RepID=A0A0E9TXH4_ANGAN